MYDETNVPGPEYRVRMVPRYIVTRYCHPYQSQDGQCGSNGGSTVVGEFAGEQLAFDVANALSKADPRSTVTV